MSIGRFGRSMSNSPTNSPGTSRIARNTGWNLLGMLLPIVVAIFSVPVLIHGLGAPRFGVLTIGWLVMSYFGQFNCGLGRATAKRADFNPTSTNL